MKYFPLLIHHGHSTHSDWNIYMLCLWFVSSETEFKNLIGKRLFVFSLTDTSNVRQLESDT